MKKRIVSIGLCFVMLVSCFGILTNAASTSYTAMLYGYGTNSSGEVIGNLQYYYFGHSDYVASAAKWDGTKSQLLNDFRSMPSSYTKIVYIFPKQESFYDKITLGDGDLTMADVPVNDLEFVLLGPQYGSGAMGAVPYGLISEFARKGTKHVFGWLHSVPEDQGNMFVYKFTEYLLAGNTYGSSISKAINDVLVAFNFDYNSGIINYAFFGNQNDYLQR